MIFEQQIRAAEGYFELGMQTEALAVLDRLPPENQERAETLRMRISIWLTMEDWAPALKLSTRMCDLYPSESFGFIHKAFCLHELGATAEAKQTLLDGPASLLEEPIYYYNLGCYDAALGNLESAQAYLRASFRLDKSFRDFAKSDPDLAGIRDLL
jgi:predicted Zn-dependent protease